MVIFGVGQETCHIKVSFVYEVCNILNFYITKIDMSSKYWYDSRFLNNGSSRKKLYQFHNGELERK